MNLNNYIRDIPDFPKKGIIFKDITPLLKNKDAYNYTIEEFKKRIITKKIDYIIGIESRGFILGAALAQTLNCGFVPIRKKGKLPYTVISQTYDLEYGKDTLEVNLKLQAKKIIIVDDLLATGGTAQAACELLNNAGATVSCFISLIELDFLNGRKKIDVPIETLIRY